MLPDETVIKPTNFSMRWNLIKSTLVSLIKTLYIVAWLDSFSITIYFKIDKILWSFSASPCQQLWEYTQWCHNKWNRYSFPVYVTGFRLRLTTDILLGQKGYQKSQASVDSSLKDQELNKHVLAQGSDPWQHPLFCQKRLGFWVGESGRQGKQIKAARSWISQKFFQPDDARLFFQWVIPTGKKPSAPCLLWDWCWPDKVSCFSANETWDSKVYSRCCWCCSWQSPSNKREGHICVRRSTSVCVAWGWQQLPNELCCFSCHAPQEQRLNQNMCKTEAMAVSILSTVYTEYLGFGTYYTPFSAWYEIQVDCWSLWPAVPLTVRVTDKVSVLKLSRSSRNKTQSQGINLLLWTVQVALFPACLLCPLPESGLSESHWEAMAFLLPWIHRRQKHMKRSRHGSYYQWIWIF